MRYATLLFPGSYFTKNEVDDNFRAEWDAAVSCGFFNCSLFDFNSFEEGGSFVLAKPIENPALPLVYRGWMMKPEQYERFYDELVAMGLRPITTPEHYDALHMFSQEVYERFGNSKDGESWLPGYPDTPVAIEFEGTHVEADSVNSTFSRFMMKDRVKSAKGTSFPQWVDTPVTQKELDDLVSEFVKLRGELFTGGIVLKEFVDLKKYDGATNEWRAFYFAGALLTLQRNSNQAATCPSVPDSYVKACANLGSPYYTLDFAELEDGSWIAIETGDGQVSGLAASQDPVLYYRVFGEAAQRCLDGYSDARFEHACEIVCRDAYESHYISDAKDFGDRWAFSEARRDGMLEDGGPGDVAHAVSKSDFSMMYEPMCEAMERWDMMPDIPIPERFVADHVESEY